MNFEKLKQTIEKKLNSNKELTIIKKQPTYCTTTHILHIAPNIPINNPTQNINKLNTTMWEQLNKYPQYINNVRNFEYNTITKLFKLGFTNIIEDTTYKYKGISHLHTKQIIQLCFYPNIETAQYITDLTYDKHYLKHDELITLFPKLLPQKQNKIIQLRPKTQQKPTSLQTHLQ